MSAEPTRREIVREAVIFALIVFAFGAAFVWIQWRFNDRNALSFDPHGTRRGAPANGR